MRKELVIQKTKSQDREAETIFLHAHLKFELMNSARLLFLRLCYLDTRI